MNDQVIVPMKQALQFKKHPRTGMFYLSVPASASAKLKDEKRIICTIGKHTFHCALQHSKDIGYFVYIGKANQKKIIAAGNDTKKLIFAKDTSRYQFTMPVELKAVLATDPEATTAFNALTPGRKRSLMYLISQPKSSNKKIERALLISQRLKLGITSAQQIVKH